MRNYLQEPVHTGINKPVKGTHVKLHHVPYIMEHDEYCWESPSETMDRQLWWQYNGESKIIWDANKCERISPAEVLKKLEEHSGEEIRVEGSMLETLCEKTLGMNTNMTWRKLMSYFGNTEQICTEVSRLSWSKGSSSKWQLLIELPAVRKCFVGDSLKECFDAAECFFSF